jgi:hypothetical protein
MYSSILLLALYHWAGDPAHSMRDVVLAQTFRFPLQKAHLVPVAGWNLIHLEMITVFTELFSFGVRAPLRHAYPLHGS